MSGSKATNRPRVSIIVPVYNAERYLGDCLNSLRSQTLEDIEVICIDDGSRDGSAAILDAVAREDPRIRVFHRENGGVSSARNLGIDEARGNFIQFVDADDLLAADACERLVSLADKEGADIVVFGGKTFPTVHWADASFAQYDKVVRGASIRALFEQRGSYPLMCNKLYRRTLVTDNGCRLNESLAIGEDNAFQFTVFPLAKTIAYTKDRLYYYRMHDTSAVGSNAKDHDTMAWKHLDVVKTILAIWDERGYLRANQEQMLYWVVSFLYNETSHMSFNGREKFAASFSELLDRYFPDYVAGVFRLDRTASSRIGFLLEAARSFDEEPLVTFVVESLTGDALDEDALGALCLQTDQRTRTLFIAPDEGGFRESARKVAANDRRATVLGSAAPMDVLPLVESPFVWHVYAEESFDLSAVRQFACELRVRPMTPYEDEEKDSRYDDGPLSPDVLVFTDTAGICTVKGPFDFGDPDLSHDVADDTYLAPVTWKGSFLEGVTLFTSNKLFSFPHLVDVCTAHAGEHSVVNEWQALLWCALGEASQVTLAFLPVLSLSPVVFRDSDTLDAAMGRLDTARSALGDRSEMALAQYLQNLLSLLIRRDNFEALYAYAATALEGTAPEGDRRDLLTMVAKGVGFDRSKEYIQGGLITRLMGESASNISEMGVLLGDITTLNARLVQYLNSPTFKIGRAVLTLPSKARKQAIRFLKGQK